MLAIEFAEHLIANITAYASLPKQSYPLNVRVVPPLLPATFSSRVAPYEDIPFEKAHKIYQKINKCIRQNTSFDHLLITN